MPKPIGNIVEGPLGWRVPEKTARIMEATIKAAPDGHNTPRRVAKASSEFSLDAGSRKAVSLITTDDVDRDGEVVLPDGIDLTTYNGTVTFAHSYDTLPVGRNLWIKPKKTPRGSGLIAATQYAVRPKDWSSDWLPDAVLSLQQEGMCTGFSIGFIPREVRDPTRDEIKARPDWKGKTIIPAAALLEYAVCSIPCNAAAELQVVSKGFDASADDVLLAAQRLRDTIRLETPATHHETPPEPDERPTGKLAGPRSAGVAFKSLEARDGDAEPLSQQYVQYIQNGGSFSPVGDVSLGDALPRHAYRVSLDWPDGVVFDAFSPKTDELLRFKSSVAEDVLAEIDRFWGLKPDYDKLGLLHNRGVMLYGPPGSGKTSVLHQVAEMIVGRGDVVLYGRSIPAVAAGLAAFREVEPDRKAVVVLEDADEYIDYQEREFLQLLDGEKSIDGVLYLATTNYIESFPPRLLRPGRFDKKVYVGPPAYDARLAYLTAKVVDTDVGAAEEVARLAAETDGLSFGDLRELVVAVYALKESPDDALARLRGSVDGRVKSWRKAADLRKRSADSANESTATDGGYIVSESTPCPRCKSIGQLRADETLPGDRLVKCQKCDARFRMKDGGEMEMLEPAAETKAVAPVLCNPRCDLLAAAAKGEVDHEAIAAACRVGSTADYLAITTDADGSPAYLYPAGVNGKAAANLVAKAAVDAAAAGHAEVAELARRLAVQITRHPPVPPTYVSPETLRRAVERKAAERRAKLLRMADDRAEDHVARVLGRP